MSRPPVRLVFALVGAVLLLQYGVVGLVGLHGSEPWPAVLLPGFKKIYETSEGFSMERAQIEVVFKNGTRASVPIDRFLAPLPRSHHPSFFEKQCRPASLTGTSRSERCRTPEGRRWFVARAGHLFPDRSIRGVDVVWERLRIEPETASSTTRPLDTLRISAPAAASR